MKPIDVNKGIVDVGKIVDNVTSTEDEASVHATNRLISDNNSGSWIPKAIRPILSVFYSGLYAWLLNKGLALDVVSIETALITTGAIVTSIIGFYFHGRNKLKIVEMQAKSAIRITELQTKAQLKEEKKQSRADRRTERQANRRN